MQLKPETRPNSSHYGHHAILRAALPPSPPMSSDASFEGYNSPSTKSVSQLSTTSNYYFEATPPLSHLDDARHMTSVPRVHQVQTSAYQQQFAHPTYMSQPAMASYYPPMQPTPPPQPPMQGLYYQRPLPQVCSLSFSSQPRQLTELPRLSLLCLCRWLSLRRPEVIRGNTTTTSHLRRPPRSPSPRTATFARPATRPFHDRARCGFTATHTRARSPSSAHTPGAERPLAFVAT